MRDQFDFENAPIFGLVPPLAAVKSSNRWMTPDVIACGAIARRANVKHGHSLELFLSESVLSDGCIVHFQKLSGLRIKNPGGKRRVRKEEPEHGFALLKSLFPAAAIDCKCDMSANRIEKFQIALVVRIFVLIVLNNEDADGFGRSF